MTVPTLLFLHAHPDDECILTGATIAAATRRDWRVLVAYATRGDAGETNKDLDGETLGARRTKEAVDACSELGVARVEWLGYDDSGMVGTDTTTIATAFCNADVDEVATVIAETFSDETIDVVVGYDVHGTYGHPDHVMIHHIMAPVASAVRAAWMMQATYNRDYLAALDDHPYGDTIAADPTAFASAASELTHYVEGVEVFGAKAAAIEHHHSQVPDDWDDDVPGPERLDGFARVFGTEWYITTPVNESADWDPLGGVFADAAGWSGAPPSMLS